MIPFDVLEDKETIFGVFGVEVLSILFNPA